MAGLKSAVHAERWTNKLQKYLEWRKSGLITPQQGVVIASIDEHQRAAQNNRNSLTDYRRSLIAEKERPSGDGATMISKYVAEERGVAASGFIYWMSTNQHDVTSLVEPELNRFIEEYVKKTEQQRKRKQPGSGETSTTPVLRNLIDKYIHWLKTGEIQRQRGVLTSSVVGSEDALKNNKKHLQEYREALKQAQTLPVPGIDQIISKKAAQNRAGSASRLINALSEKGLDITTLDNATLQRELTALYDAVPADKRSTRAKLESEIGKFLEWSKRPRNAAIRSKVPVSHTEDEVENIQVNTEHIDAYKAVLAEAATSTEEDAPLISDNVKKNRGTEATAFINWIGGGHNAALLNEEELMVLKTDYLDSKFPLIPGQRPSGSRRALDSSLNKYIDWRMSGDISPQRGGVGSSGLPDPAAAEKNDNNFAAYRSALATASLTPAGDGNFIVSKTVKEGRSVAAAAFIKWANRRGEEIFGQDHKTRIALRNTFLVERYPGNNQKSRKNKERLLSALTPYFEWHQKGEMPAQKGVEVITEQHIQRLLQQNRAQLSGYLDMLAEAKNLPENEEGVISPAMEKNRRSNASLFVTWASRNELDLSRTSAADLDSSFEDYISEKFADSRATIRNELKHYVAWLKGTNYRSVRPRARSPGLFVSSDSE